MFIAKKLLARLILPPGTFVVLLTFSGLWFLFRKNRVAGLVNCLMALLIWLLSIAPVSDALMGGLESGYRIPENPRGDVVILLCGGVNSNTTELSGVSTLSAPMSWRLVSAVHIQRSLNIPMIVTGKDESRVVKKILVDIGIPEDKIIVEEEARDTSENARYTKEICVKNGYKMPILVTCAHHMKRAVLSFKKVGMDVIPYASNFKTSNDTVYEWIDYLPNINDFYDSYSAIHEYLGLLFYKVSK